MKHTNKTAIIYDGDMLVFKAAAAAEVVTDWGDDLWTCHSYLSEAIVIFRNMLTEVRDALSSHHGVDFSNDAIVEVVAFSDAKNFRKELLPTYKANRKNSRKPVCYKPLVDYAFENMDCYREPSLEGDDVMSIKNDCYRDKGYRCILVSGDKDFNTVPCEFFNINDKSMTKITPKEAIRNHAYQTLIGDTADNYKGCPSYGPVKAKKLLDKTSDEDLWDAVIKAFEEQGLTKEDALVQARMAHLLSNTEYVSCKVKLWEFPNKA